MFFLFVPLAAVRRSEGGITDRVLLALPLRSQPSSCGITVRTPSQMPQGDSSRRSDLEWRQPTKLHSSPGSVHDSVVSRVKASSTTRWSMQIHRCHLFVRSDLASFSVDHSLAHQSAFFSSEECSRLVRGRIQRDVIPVRIRGGGRFSREE